MAKELTVDRLKIKKAQPTPRLIFKSCFSG
jgi:hypothetical protein